MGRTLVTGPANRAQTVALPRAQDQRAGADIVALTAVARAQRPARQWHNARPAPWRRPRPAPTGSPPGSQDPARRAHREAVERGAMGGLQRMQRFAATFRHLRERRRRDACASQTERGTNACAVNQAADFFRIIEERLRRQVLFDRPVAQRAFSGRAATVRRCVRNHVPPASHAGSIQAARALFTAAPPLVRRSDITRGQRDVAVLRRHCLIASR